MAVYCRRSAESYDEVVSGDLSPASRCVVNCLEASGQVNVTLENNVLRLALASFTAPHLDIKSYLATPIGFEPTISTVTRWHVNRYTTGPYRNFSTNAGAVNAPRPRSRVTRRPAIMH